MHIEMSRGGMNVPYSRRESLTNVGARSVSTRVPQRRSERVLVVEPDSRVRASITQVLDDMGYRYLEASDPREAIALLQSSLEIEVLICDIDLPSLSGRRLAQIALARRPGLRVLLVVGDASLQSSSVLDEGIQTLTRSFTLPAFAHAMRG